MKDFKICDTHNDFLTELQHDQVLEYVKSCKKENVQSLCASFWTTKKSKEEILKELPIRAELLRKANLNLFLHIEDLWWVQTQTDLQFLLSLHPFSCSLTWNEINSLAGGTNSEGELTSWGRKVLHSLVDAGVVVDVAHLNRKSFWQVENLLEKKLYCSHAGFSGVRRKKRNLTDKQIDAIVRSGGFVGLFFFDKCVKPSKSKGKPFAVEDVVESLQYFTSRWGFDHIGIGSDFYGIETFPKNLETYCDFKNLVQLLKTEGWTEKQIEKVLSKNFQVFQTTFSV